MLGDELEFAWKHLAAGDPHGQGWQTIPLSPDRSLHLLAGRRFPENQQALLVGFPGLRIARKDIPSESEGFYVESVTMPGSAGVAWLALTRKSGSGADLFHKMAAELAEIVHEHSASSIEKMFQSFVGRIRAWQEFMRKSKAAMSLEEEIGFIGELLILSKLVESGLQATSALRAWEGPQGGLQDFLLGSGAIEVKSSLSTTGFVAHITSLDQLDDATRQPIFVAAIRLRIDPAGMTLPQYIDGVHHLVANEPEADRLLREHLLSAGYSEQHASLYERRMTLVGLELFEVDSAFPRLTGGTVPNEVRHAVYDIDLDQVKGPRLDLANVMKRLGVS